MTLPTLTLGSFNLNDSLGLQQIGAAVMAEGTSRGNPVPIEVTIRSWLQDGNIAATQGYDNREVSLRIRLVGTSLTAVAQLEAALVAELNQPNTLTWTPASGPASVFDVVTSSLDQDDTFDSADIVEAQHNLRFYKLRMVCLPWVHSAAEVITAALPASGTTTTLVNDGSATTGWTGAVDGVTTAPTVVSGAVRVTTGSAVTGQHTVTTTLTASITTSSTKYVMVDWKPESADGSPTLRAFGDTVELTLAGQIGLPSGLTRSWFGPVVASSIAVLRLDSQTTSGGTLNPFAALVRSLYIDNVNRTDAKPALGTTRQQQRTIAVSGSARTQGSVAVEHATSALGDVLAYFWPKTSDPRTANYSPAMRQYRAGGGAGSPTADSSMVSGARETLTAFATIYSIPLNALPPGLYVLVARLNVVISGGNASLAWIASTSVNAAAVDSGHSGGRSLTSTGGNYSFIALDRLILPTVDVTTSSTGTLGFSLTGTVGGSSTITLDEFWLLNTSIGQYNQLSCGTGTAASGGPSNRVFIEPATADRPRPAIRRGFAADGSDSFYPVNALSAWQPPQFVPPSVNVLTVTTNALDASVSMRHLPRWHSHAAS